MAMDTTRIRVFAGKAPVKSCYNLVMKFPIPSFVTTFFFLLYMFLPLVSAFLICSVLSALAAVIYRVSFRADLKGFENVKGYKNIDEKTPVVKDDDMDKNVSVSGDSQTIRRRNVNKKDREDYTHSSIEDKNVASPAGFDDGLVDKTAVAEENIKEFRDVKVDSADKRARHSLVNDLPQCSGVIAETEGEISDDSEDDAHEYTHNPETSHIPGSASSVLLPMHNPLDILYDLQEEKNIQESFQSENLADQHKDLMFCRHESINLGAFCPVESRQDQTFHAFSFHPRPSERREYSRAVNKAGIARSDIFNLTSSPVQLTYLCCITNSFLVPFHFR